jgi:penicillin-binding protein 1A
VAPVDGAAAIDQIRPAGEPTGGPVPPAGIGEAAGGKATGATRRTTLFDLLTGG